MSFDCTASALGSYHVSHATIDDLYQYALSLARDFVKGYYGDYYFFQFDTDEYCLILSNDISFVSTDASIFDATVYVFQCSPVMGSSSRELALTASDPVTTTAIYDITGSITLPVYDWSFISFDLEACHIYNGEYIYYSSVGQHAPRLCEGVVYYAFLLCALVIGVTGWVIVDRIFRRVY